MCGVPYNNCFNMEKHFELRQWWNHMKIDSYPEINGRRFIKNNYDHER